jgi:hypothetical protein
MQILVLLLGFDPFPASGWTEFMKGELSFQIANSQVIKQLPIEWSYGAEVLILLVKIKEI